MIRQPIPFNYNDGGRKEAGFKGKAGDCVVRSIAIAIQQPYRYVYDSVNSLARIEKKSRTRDGKSNARLGVHRVTFQSYLEEEGWTWVPTMVFGQGCSVHMAVGELPDISRVVVRLSKHLSCVVDGVVQDTHDICRGGDRCVYGYFYKGESYDDDRL